MRSALPWLLLACSLAARTTANAQPTLSPECARPHSRLLAQTTVSSLGASVAGDVVSMDDHPLAETIVELSGESARSAETNATGRFRFDSIPKGRYQLRTFRIGYETVTDSITVPVPHDLRIQLATNRDFIACVNERILAERPILVPSRVDSATRVSDLADGARVRHRVTATPTADGVEFRSRITNFGTTTAHLTSLCYPKATASILREVLEVGPGCYGGGLELRPGDSVTVITRGPLRGSEGRYEFRIHAVDPATLDVVFSLSVRALPER